MTNEARPREFEYCPTCGGELDTGWECTKCGLDWRLWATLHLPVTGDVPHAEQLERFRSTSLMLSELRAPEGEPAGPEPGFYARVLQRIDRQQEEPFWVFFLQPLFVRRLAFGSLMWLALVGSYVISFGDASEEAGRRLAGSVLTEQSVADYYRVRLGNDLEQNRDSMLAVVMTAGE